MIVLAALPLAFVFRRRSGLASALALLALVFLLRAVLDPVDQNYFHAPFFIALLSLEVTVAGRVSRVPFLTLAALGGYWLAFHGTACTTAASARARPMRPTSSGRVRSSFTSSVRP